MILAVGLAGTAWILLGYPASLLLRRERPTAPAAGAPPSLTVVVCVCGEPEAQAKLAGLITSDYPERLLEVVIAADGERSAATAAIAACPGATVTWSETRRGKAQAIGDALALATGEIVVLTDANNLLDPGALAAAAARFADPGVWAVAGARAERGSAYDRYEDLLRRLESRSGSVAAASGELLAIRRERMPAIPPGIVNDDLWLICQVVRAGGRVVYEPRARGIEDALGARGELERRTRIGAGRVALAGELRRVPLGFAWRLFNHKIARLALPFLVAATAAGIFAGARRSVLCRVAATGQAVVAAAAAAGCAGWSPPGRAAAFTRASRQIVLGLLATGRGVVRGLTRRQPAAWRTVR